MPQDRLGLFDTPPSPNQTRLSIAVIAGLVALLPASRLISDVQLGPVAPFIPMNDAIMALTDLIIAALLYVQAGVYRSRALTVLASGYVYTGLIIIPHALTFPGAFSPGGLLGAKVSTTAWLYNFWRAGAPIATIFYVLIDRADSGKTGLDRQRTNILLGILVAIALAVAVTVLTTKGHDLLPGIYLDRVYSNRPAFLEVTALVMVIFFIAMGLLLWHRRSVLDLWLLVVMSACIIQTLLLSLLPGRFTAAWYAAAVVVVVTHMFLMIGMIAESSRLYSRLARTTAERNRERDARLMSMDAVAAAIAHEVGQPLAAVTASASAGASWLDRPDPDVEKASKAVHAALDAGRLAFDALRSIRAMFANGHSVASDVDLNDVVRKTALLLDMELTNGSVALHLALDEALPPIVANRVQLERVIANLMTNAIESVRATRGRYRRIDIRSTRANDREVLVEVSDNGTGIEPGQMARIFDAFFTTKDTGTGLGLSLSTTIVKEHGGRLWASSNEEHGATFHVQLPRAHLPAH